MNPKIQSTLDAAALCKMAERGQITGGVLDGPLAFADGIVEAGNMLAKQLQYLAGADSAAIVLGTRVPIVLTSRADSVRTRIASAAVMALVADARWGRPSAAGPR